MTDINNDNYELFCCKICNKNYKTEMGYGNITKNTIK